MALFPHNITWRRDDGLVSALALPPALTGVDAAIIVAGELGIPSIVLGPGEPSLFHVVDEYMSLDQLIKGTEVYQRLAEKRLSS